MTKYEYEFRLTVSCDEDDFNTFVSDTIRDLKSDSRLFRVRTFRIFYVRPHFRLKEGESPEWKRVLSSRAFHHDGLWFRFVESEETPFSAWSRSRTARFLENAGHFACPVSVEFRHEFSSDVFPQVKMYAFRKANGGGKPEHGVAFETEVGLFDRRPSDPTGLAMATVNSLMKRFYRIFKSRKCLSTKPLTSFSGDFYFHNNNNNNDCMRKSVVPLHPSRAREMFERSSSFSSFFTSDVVLIAPKHDGIFGFVHVRPDRIRELWEDNLQRVRRGGQIVGCPPDIVYGAERMPDGSAILLDVYRCGGCDVRTTESLLTEFLPGLETKNLPYRVQTYRRIRPSDASLMSSGGDWVLHDVTNDAVYKLKRRHTVDLVHYEGFFWMPDNNKKKKKKTVPAPEGLVDGSVYECSLEGFAPLKRRDDRFCGNSALQWSQIASAASSFSNG